MAITGQAINFWTRSHASDDSYTEGHFEYVEHQIVPSNMTMTAQLTATQAHNTGPFAAAVGFVDVKVQEEDIPDFHGNPADPWSWTPVCYGTILKYRLGIHVARGTMTCSLIKNYMG